MKKNIFKRIETDKELPKEIKEDILSTLPELDVSDLNEETDLEDTSPSSNREEVAEDE
ncbi:hypothetical protein FK220_004100 [Flavobacteriaceae bacterium TP-CH-4]|uniref:Uncharacterized protein n=1 Tax=Pelagihabitans pacificus TaxID=2696054 RepID=A0A967AQD7_9FLAO|nr:hypothetical protein [Pelagihabitans pacificus]NHF58506.1 hypothetical protein [Pelagihabitans pacificus]